MMSVMSELGPRIWLPALRRDCGTSVECQAPTCQPCASRGCSSLVRSTSMPRPNHLEFIAPNPAQIETRLMKFKLLWLLKTEPENLKPCTSSPNFKVAVAWDKEAS